MHIHIQFGLAGFAAASVLAFAHAALADDSAGAAVPASSDPPALVLTVTIVETPDQSDPAVTAWAAHVKDVLDAQYAPIMAELPGGTGGERKVELRLERSPDGIAATSGGTIHANLNYFMQHGDDVGALVHELAHVVQSYPSYEFWLTEGIADWVRNFNYERKTLASFKGQGAGDYKSGYKDAARFLEWLRLHKQPTLIPVLNSLLRAGKYDAATFWPERCGAKLDTLWQEYSEWWAGENA